MTNPTTKNDTATITHFRVKTIILHKTNSFPSDAQDAD